MSLYISLDDQLALLLIAQVSAVSTLSDDQSTLSTEEAMHATKSLKNLSEAILALKIAGVIRLDQESIAVLMDRIAQFQAEAQGRY